jgi:hypothetical protein
MVNMIYAIVPSLFNERGTKYPFENSRSFGYAPPVDFNNNKYLINKYLKI